MESKLLLIPSVAFRVSDLSQYLIEPVWNQNDSKGRLQPPFRVSISNRTSMESKLKDHHIHDRFSFCVSQYLIEPVWNQNFSGSFLRSSKKAVVSISNRTSMESKRCCEFCVVEFRKRCVSISNRTSMESKRGVELVRKRVRLSLNI